MKLKIKFLLEAEEIGVEHLLQFILDTHHSQLNTKIVERAKGFTFFLFL
jgi:hypothetical protein